MAPQQAPPGFTYAAKLGRFGSHRMKLKDTPRWLPNHLDRLDRLGDHAGPTLVQLPPRWRRNVERLDEFLTVAGPGRRWAVELRDPSWFHDDVFDCLERHDAALCLHDLLPDHPWLLTTDWAYLRFHGPAAPDAPYEGRYGPARLRRTAERLAAILAGGDDVYACSNNDFDEDTVVGADLVRDPPGATGARPGAARGQRRKKAHRDARRHGHHGDRRGPR